MGKQEFTPSEAQRALMDAAGGVRLNGNKVSRLIHEADDLLLAASQLSKGDCVERDSAVDLIGIVHERIFLVRALIDGDDVADLFDAVVRGE